MKLGHWVHLFKDFISLYRKMVANFLFCFWIDKRCSCGSLDAEAVASSKAIHRQLYVQKNTF